MKAKVGKKPIIIEKCLLYDLYYNKKLSSRDIGRKLNVCYKIVLRNMEDYGFKARDIKEYQKYYIRKDRHPISRALLTHLYLNQKMSIKKTAKELNVGVGVIHNRLKRYNFKIRGMSEARMGIKMPENSKLKKQINFDKNILYDLYYNQKITQHAIAKIFYE
jgi:IS30 family transposase